MQYLRALQKRSIFLWRSLFSGQPETGEKLPVYIERPSAARAAEGQEDAEPVADAGAAVPDRKENRPIIPAREAKTGAVRDFARPGSHNKMEIITGIKPSDMLNAEESIPL